jgi:hypothetical protein
MLVTPYCKRTRPGRGTNTKVAGFPPLTPVSLRLPSPLRAPSRADPSGLGHAATIYSSVQGPPRFRNADTSTPPLSPRPAGERADRHAGGMQPHQGAHPFDFDASSMEAQAHTSCNRCAGYYVREAAPPLAPVSCLLDCGTSAATRGDPAHGPIVPTEYIGHGSVSRGRRRDDRYDQKWGGSDGGGRRKQRSSRLQAHVPSWDSERALSHGVKTTRPCSVP